MGRGLLAVWSKPALAAFACSIRDMIAPYLCCVLWLAEGLLNLIAGMVLAKASVGSPLP